MYGARGAGQRTADDFDIQWKLGARWSMHARPVIAPRESFDLLRRASASVGELLSSEPRRRVLSAVRHRHLFCCQLTSWWSVFSLRRLAMQWPTSGSSAGPLS